MTQQQMIKNFGSELLSWASDNLRRFPWRETTDSYEILIAEILFQKTVAEKVERIYEEFLSMHPSLAELADIIYSLGFQNQRSKAFVLIGQILQDRGIPDDADRLLKLPYVGQYAANAILCFAFGKLRPIVDASVVRVYSRISDKEFNYRGEENWSFAASVLPADDARSYNLAILDFADIVCQPKVPDCANCFLTDSCCYYQANQTG